MSSWASCMQWSDVSRTLSAFFWLMAATGVSRLGGTWQSNYPFPLQGRSVYCIIMYNIILAIVFHTSNSSTTRSRLPLTDSHYCIMLLRRSSMFMSASCSFLTLPSISSTLRLGACANCLETKRFCSLASCCCLLSTSFWRRTALKYSLEYSFCLYCCEKAFG